MVSLSAQLPLAFKAGPYFPDPCIGTGAFAMLGFGDIVIPGLLIAYTYRFQLTSRCRAQYFLAALFGIQFVWFPLCKLSSAS